MHQYTGFFAYGIGLETVLTGGVREGSIVKKELWRKKMLHIGCHLSSSKGFAAMGETAVSIGADSFAFFTRNPRGGSAKAADPADGATLMRFYLWRSIPRCCWKLWQGRTLRLGVILRN